MTKPAPTATKRIDQLDGLRGLAIILVVLNHLHLSPLYTLFPKVLQPFLGSLLNSGKVGVGILFLLSGFFMALLYPNVQSKSAFWQKRYTRIFPAFVSMCLALSIIEYFGTSLSPASGVAVILGISIVGGALWKLIIQNPKRVAIGKFLFYSFILFQGAAILGYIFVLSRVPPSVFYIVWPKWSHDLVYFIMNSTVALPFGNYVPLIDGAYWSVITEVLFYLLYPILLLPIMKSVFERRSKVLDVLCIILSLPFFYGLSILFKSILGFQIMQIYLAIYFVFGVAIGFFYQSESVTSMQRFIYRIPAPLIIAACLILVGGLPYVRDIFHWGENIDTVYWAIPVSLLLIITLARENRWIAALRNPVLRTIGGLSYAIYLTHLFAIELFFKSVEPKTLAEMFAKSALALSVVLILSAILHYCLGNPYFSHKIVSSEKEKKHVPLQIQKVSSLHPLWVGIGIFLFLVWLAYRIPTTFASVVVNHTDQSLPTVSAITTTPVVLHFVGDKPNLGMIFLNLKVLSGNDLATFHLKNGGDTFQFLVADVLGQNGKTIIRNRYPLYQIYDSAFFTIGLPPQADSEGRQFTINLRASSTKAFQVLGLVNSTATLRSVYFFNKKDLLLHPIEGISILWNKLSQPFMGKEALTIALYCGPLSFALIFGLAIRRRTRII